MRIGGKKMLRSSVIVGGALAFLGLAFLGLNFQKLLLRMVIGQQVKYFHSPSSSGSGLEKLTSRVYTFNWYFDRTLVVDTDDGLVVVDPFSRHLTTALRQSLTEAGLTKPVHTLIYTHYHLDHVRGGDVLAPQNVVAHRKCPSYWADRSTVDRVGILPPTRLVDGDVELQIGGVLIRLVHLDRSHTDTMYAVHIPSEGVLFAADTVGVKVLLPGGGVSVYTPGYLRALDRLAELDFNVFVASHFGHGTKQDYNDAVQLQKDIHQLVRDAHARRDGPVPVFMDEKRMQEFVDEVYPVLQQRYGHWHGFNSQALASIFAAYTAQYVGD